MHMTKNVIRLFFNLNETKLTFVLTLVINIPFFKNDTTYPKLYNDKNEMVCKDALKYEM